MEGVGDIYNPRSVVEAISEGKCMDYWNRTGGFSELEEYITQNFDGLEDTITKLIAGESVSVNVLGFSNDLDSFQDRDEVITALDYYKLEFEANTGKGFADCLMFPRRSGIPGIIIELKYDKSPEEAVEQIKQRNYVKKLEGLADEILLIGINCDKKSKKHQCMIESIIK